MHTFAISKATDSAAAIAAHAQDSQLASSREAQT